MHNKKVNVLGTEYVIKVRKLEEDEKLKENNCSGYMDYSIKTIVIAEYEDDIRNCANMQSFYNTILRHELVHAFLYESGLHQETWACNEEMVDWIALQIEKIVKVCNELEIM